MKFGYLAKKDKYSSSNWSIDILPKIKSYKELKTDLYYIEKGWIYPRIEHIDFKGGKYPLKPSPWFRPLKDCSHEIKVSLSSFSEEDTNLLILYFGFLNGLHLLPEGWGYLYRTAIEPGKLVSFVCFQRQIVWLVDQSIMTIKNSSPKIKKLLYAMLNWFLIGQSYYKEYERFEAEYRIIDIAYRIETFKGNASSCSHAERIIKLANIYSLFIPNWAIINSKSKVSIISEARNELIHEAMYNSQPIGMSYRDDNLSLELTRYNELIILRNFGADSQHFKAPDRIMDLGFVLMLTS